MALVSKKNLLEEYEEEQKKNAAKQKTTSAANETNKAAQEAAARKEADLIGAKDAGKISSKKSTLPSQKSAKQGASDFVANAYNTAQKAEYKTEKKDKTVTTAEINKKQQEAKKTVQENKSVVGNLINASALDQKVKTDNNITLQNREDFKAKQQAEAAEKAKAIIQNIIDNARNDAVIKQTVTPENREKAREQKREEVWETKEDDGAAALAIKGLGNRFRTVPGTLIESGAEAFYDMTGDTVKGYSEGDKITLENRDAAKTAKIADNSAWFLNPAREKAKEIAETKQAGGIYDMATEQLDSLRAMTDNELVQDLITAADGGATMLGYMALPFGTKYLSAYMAAGQVLDTYNSRREMGESKEEAAVRGITDGAIAAAVESLGGVGKIPGLNKAADVIEAAAGKNFLTNLVMQALSECGEGFAEYALGYVGNVMNDLAFKGEIQTEFDINEAIESAWIEGLAGGMFGAGSFGIRKISGDPNTDATIGEVSSDIIAAVKSVFDMDNKKAEMPVPFNGNAVTEEQQLVAEKIAEIENSSLNEIEKAEKMEEIAKAVAETTGSADVVAEAEKFKDLHRQKELDRATEVANRLGNVVEFDDTIVGNGIHQEDGTIIINPNSKNPVMQILVHELTHDIETSGLYGDFSQKILNYAAEVRKIDLAKMEQMVISDYAKAGQKLDKTLADREIVAKFAEEHLFTDEKAIERLCNTDPTLFDRIKYWISDMVAKFRGTPEERFLRDAERLYEKALATRREITGAGMEQHSYDYSKPFEQQIDDWKNGLIPQRDTLIVGATPKVLQDVGFNALPMTINQTHIEYAINGTKGLNHFYGADIKKLPQALENPVAIISSKTQKGTSVVVLVNLPVNGLETIVPVYIDGTGHQNNLIIDANAITSAHGRNNTAQLLADAINDNAAGNTSVFYYNKKEAQPLLHRAGLQLPGAVMPRDGFNHSIRENGSPVKPKLDDVTESLQFKRWFGDWEKHPQNASKVINPDGTPKIVYHGTRNANFTVFNRSWNFFTDNKEMADSYSPNGDMYEVYLDIKKPFVIDAYGEKWSRVPISDEVKEILDNYGASTFEEDGEWRTTPADIASAIADGIDEGEFDYDGIIIENVDDTGGYYKNNENNLGTDYIVFDSKKVKSATDNIGTFDPQNPDIRYSAGRGFDEMAAESISAEISDSAKRVAAMVAENESKRAKENQSTTSQVNPEEESTNLVDVPQSKKSERIEKRFRRRVENGIASVFGVQSSDLKGDIRPIIEEITADLKDGKQITNEQIDRVYKQAFEDGVIAEEFPQYQNTRKYIRSTPIYVDKTTQDEFGDTYAFRDFARSNFGSMKISSDPRSSHLDSFYKTLSEIEPDYFNAEETDPKTQLEDIADFMQQTKKQYYGLSEVYSGENLADFEKWAKKELKAYMEEFGKGIDTVRMYERDRQIKATNKAREIDRDASFDQAKAAFEGNKIFEAQKAAEIARQNTLLSDTDLVVLKRLHEGTMTEADVIFQNAGNVEGIIEVYNAEKAYKQARAPFDRYKAAYKTSLEVDAIANTAFSDEWKDKNIGLEYSRETAERNIKDITENGRFGGKEIIKEYIEPVHEHEAMKNRWLSEMNRRAKEIGFGRMNKYERAYTQMIGENYKYIAEGKITKHDQFEHDLLNQKIQNLLIEYGKKIDKAKCEKAAAGFMDIYKDILEQWNDERIRRGQEPAGEIEGYFPHFTEAKPENLLQRIFAVLGFEVGSSKLPTDIAGRTADRKPQSKWNPHALRRKGDVTDYDVLKGFDSYVRAVGDNIFHTEDIQKLRALSDTIRTKYSSAETEKRIEDIRNRKDLPEEEKEILIADVFKAAPGAYHLSNFVVWLDEYTNILAGKKSRGDREAEYQMGREVYDVAKALEGRIASNMIGYNISTPIMNLVPLFQAVADISPSDIISSVIQTGIGAAQKNSFISENSDFITNRFGVDTLYNQNYNLFSVENTKDFVSKVSDGGGLLMELVDRVVSESLVRARYEQNIRKGMGKVDAFSEADQWAAGLIADRSLGALPTIFNVKNPVAKALTMFQVEANNQYSYIIKDAGKYKWDNEGAYNTIIGQIAFWAAMAICNGLAKELLGRDNVVPDPIGLTAKALEKIQKGEPTGEVVYDTATNVVEQLPFVGGLIGGGRVPLSTALPDAEQAAKLLNPEISGEKKGQILLDEILKPLSYILLPSGAGQIWKSGKGIQQIAEGGAYGMDNNGKEYMKFPQVYDVDSVIKTLLFGQYASDAGQRYIDSGFSDKLSAKQTEQMKLAENFGVPKEEFYDVVLGLKGIDKKAEKQQALFDMDVSERTKNVIDGILFGKTTYKTEVPAATRNYSDPEAFYESGLEKNEFALHEMGYNEKEIETITEALKESGKKAQDIENLADALDIEEAEAFEVYQKIKGEWINEAKDLDEEDFARAEGARTLYGMSTENYITVLNYSKYGAQIKNEDGETEYSTKAEYVIPHIMEATGWNKELATEMYNRVHKYDYTRADLEEEQAKQLDTSAEWYGVEDKGYFTARNIIKMAEGEKDQYGNTVSGSKKEAAIKAIAEQMKIGTEEATVYYLAASGGLALSVDDLSTSHREDLKTAVERGWTERQYLDAVNIIKLSGADSKDEIIKTLTDAGASYSMAQGYYNLRQNKDYNKAAYFAYGMKNEKQVTKADYFMKNYGKGSVTAKDVTAWYKAASGCKKKQEYIDAYKSAGATQDQAVKFYNLMRGYDKAFNAWYKENGG